jgi:2-amino-4-hydroxy-6-hydroxymethyldihydropteridine diphosphokinase
MPSVLIGLGSNLGDRAATLERALQQLGASSEIVVTRHSAWHETAPVGGPSQPAFLNGAATIETSLAPDALLDRLHGIEQSLGRLRHEHWGPRTLDLDMLLYDQLVLDTPRLVLPHPRMAFRRFVVEPAAEIVGDWVHPDIGWTLGRLLAHLRDAVDYIIAPGFGSLSQVPMIESLVKSNDLRWIHRPNFMEERRRARVVSPVRSAQAAVEFLNVVKTLVSREDWPEPERPAISDFWFEQMRLLHRHSLDPPDEREKFDLACQQFNDEVMPPKLIVQGPRDGDYRTMFQGPVLRLADADVESQRREVAAAIEGMRRR